VQRHGMSHGYIVPEHQRPLIAHDMQHATVLHVGARANANVMNIAPNNRARPHAGIFADGYVADNYRGGIDPRAGSNLRPLPAKGSNVRNSGQYSPWLAA
jgi:hypothetical protein